MNADTTMRNIVILAALLTTGCGDLLSLHELYTNQDKVFDATLVGRWESKDDLLTVWRDGDEYKAAFQSKMKLSEQVNYEAHLLDINGVRFADILTGDALGHMFLKVRVSGSQLRFAFFDTEWVRERIPHEEATMSNGKKQAVLTAHTAELRNLVAKYAAEPKAFGNEMVFERLK